MSLSDYPLISDWLRLEGGRVTVRTGKVDIGQRISSALAQIVAEELALDPEDIGIETVTTAASPDEGMTSGSNSIQQSGGAVRAASATLRRMALAQAADIFGGDAEAWQLGPEGLTGPGSNRPVPLPDVLGDLDFSVAVDPDATPVARTELPRAPMRGIREMVEGRYTFLHDIEEPGMLHARVVHAPHARASLVDVPSETLESLAGRGLTVHRDGGFLAIAGTEEWPVVRAALRLAREAEWDTGEGLPTDDVFARLTQDNAQRLPVVDGKPVADSEVPPRDFDPDFEARYERPYTMHGALAPSAALAEWDGERLRIVTQSQGIYPLRQSIAESLDLPLDAVVLTHTPGSGCYGHNGADDAAYEAALIARAIPGRPVLLKWTREDEHCWEPYGPAQAVEIAAKVGDEGRIDALSVESIGGTFRGRPRAGPGGAGPAKLIANWVRETPQGPQPPKPNMNKQGGLQRNIDPIYAIPETRLVKNLVGDMPLRSSALRCLGAVANVFAIEGMMDELCQERGEDPYEIRLRQLDDPRARLVLERLREASGAEPSGGARGIAYAQYKNAMARVGVAVDLDVTDAAEVRLRRICLVADAGRVIDAEGLEAQLEGGAIQAASWALCEAVTWDRDGITSRDWDSYSVLRFDGIPDMDIHLLDDPDAPPLGAGEAASGPVVAAIGNAVFAAAGLRLRRLPFSPEALRNAALSI